MNIVLDVNRKSKGHFSYGRMPISDVIPSGCRSDFGNGHAAGRSFVPGFNLVSPRGGLVGA
jgi:hypothetical protein